LATVQVATKLKYEVDQKHYEHKLQIGGRSFEFSTAHQSQLKIKEFSY